MSYVLVIILVLFFLWLVSLEIRIRKLQPFLSFVDLAIWFVRNFRARQVDDDDDL